METGKIMPNNSISSVGGTRSTDLPVLLPVAAQTRHAAMIERREGTYRLNMQPRHALWVLAIFATAWAQGANSKILRNLIAGYIQLFRNTPPFVQILFFYFVLGNLVPTYDAGGYQVGYIDSFGWAVISLGFFAGSFNVEIFRSGIEAVPESTREAAEALGYTRLSSYIHVIFPLAFRVCLPALNNNLVNLLKTTRPT